MRYEDITRKIIASAIKVHNTLGNGFQEVIYQRAMELEMPYENISFSRELEMPIYYRDHQIGTRRVDFFVEEISLSDLIMHTGSSTKTESTLQMNTLQLRWIFDCKILTKRNHHG